MNSEFTIGTKSIECLVELVFGVVKDNIKDKREAFQIRERLEKFISKQQKLNWSCTLQEEIDFEGLSIYIQTTLLEDVKKYLFGTQKERGSARNIILCRATEYAKANTSLSRKRAIQITEDALNILKEFYRKKVNRELFFVAARLEDSFTEISSEQTKDLSRIICNSEKHVIEKLGKRIERLEQMPVEKHMQLLKDGNSKDVEASISNYFNALGSSHLLFPHYCYDFQSEKRQLYSKPLSEKALKDYPPRIVCTGTAQINGKYIDKLDIEAIEYANRHQFPITLNVITAKKLLGEIEDPIQHEAELIEGGSFVIPPKPFPPAFPCSIALNGEVVFDYILLRTEEVLDDDTIILSNKEQPLSPFRVKMSINIESKNIKYSVGTHNPTNEQLLQYLSFLTRASQGEIISVKALSIGEELASGKLGNVEYQSGFGDIEKEVDFIKKVVVIEHYYNDTILIPEQISVDDFEKISYLYSLIVGEECVGFWEKLEFTLELAEELKEHLTKAEDTPFSLSFVSEIAVPLYGKSYSMSVIRAFNSVVYQDLQRIKQKARILDTGDYITLGFLPKDHVSGRWNDYAYSEKNDELNG